jgi:purine catabolism regulator
VLTLGDVLDHEELELQLLVGGDEARARPVAGAHSIEFEHPTRWLDREWIMLTTGARLRGDRAAQAELIAELDDADVTALGFGVEATFKRVPPAMLAEARRRGFPILVVPFRIAFGEVVATVHRELLSDDARAIQRAVSMQRFLLDALAEEDPEQDMLERLSSILDASAGILSGSGHVDRATATLPGATLWPHIAKRPHAAIELDAGDWHACSVPLPERPHRWLVVAARGRGLASPATKEAVRSAAPLLAAVSRLRDAGRRQERLHRSRLLGRLLGDAGGVVAGGAGPRPPVPDDVAAGAEAYGLDLREPARVVLVPAGHDLERRLTATGAPHLIAPHEQGVAALVQGLDPELLEPVAGYGREISDLADAPLSLHDAELALERAAPERRVVGYEDLDPVALLIAHAPDAFLQPRLAELLAPLQHHAPLLDTLRAYFAHDLDVGRTAAALGLHANSVRYRLARVEELLGAPLHRPSVIAALQIALSVA